MLFDPKQFFYSILCNDKEAMPQTPDNKRPVGTMPQTCAEKNDQLVAVGLCLSLPVSAQGDIQVFPKPSGKRDMLSAPEFLNAGRDVWIIKVFLEVKPETQAKSNGHVTVSAEIKINLNQIAYCS